MRVRQQRLTGFSRALGRWDQLPPESARTRAVSAGTLKT